MASIILDLPILIMTLKGFLRNLQFLSSNPIKNNHTVIILMSRLVWIYEVNVMVLFTTNSRLNIHDVVDILNILLMALM